MLDALDDHLAHARQKLPERRIIIKRALQGDHVEQIAGDVGEFRTVSTVSGRSDNHLGLSGVTVQKNLVGREQQNKGGGSLCRRQRAYRLTQFVSKVNWQRCTGV